MPAPFRAFLKPPALLVVTDYADPAEAQDRTTPLPPFECAQAQPYGLYNGKFKI
jgi:hypothetical protein